MLTVLPGDGAREGLHEAGVLVLPGGGYRIHAPHEAEPVAQRFVDAGMGGAVLRYRLGSSGHRHPAMIHDALRAIRLLRAGGWSRIAVLGFSAGGHLAATAAVHFDRFDCGDDDLVDDYSARPDAVILGYPVTDMLGAKAHQGSALQLLGSDSDESIRKLLSPAHHVSDRTPPAFLWHTNEDAGVPAEHSIEFALACRAHGVPVELHVYERGAHGLGLADGARGHDALPEVAGWIDLAIAFARRHLGVCESTGMGA